MKIIKDVLCITDLENRIKKLEEKVEAHENTMHAMANCMKTQGEALKLLLYQLDIIKLNLSKGRVRNQKEEDVYN